MNVNIDANNIVMLDGFLAKDAELITKGEKSLTKLVLATNKQLFKEDGTKGESLVSYHDLVAFNSLAAPASKLKKGNRISVIGELVSNRKNETEDKVYYNTYVELKQFKNLSQVDQEQEA